MNQITIIGKLTKEPELRSTQAGVNVCGFTVAVNRPKTQNNQNPGADFFNVNAWRGLGENCARFLEKGKKVCVVGRISLRTWEKDGKHGASLEVLADDVEFLSPRVSDMPVPEEPAPVVESGGFTKVETDELPFD
jgi:single-strand DNA-binding protein